MMLFFTSSSIVIRSCNVLFIKSVLLPPVTVHRDSSDTRRVGRAPLQAKFTDGKIKGRTRI